MPTPIPTPESPTSPTLQPTGDGTGTGWSAESGAPIFDSIDDYSTGAQDSDATYVVGPNETDGSAYFDLSDFPSSFIPGEIAQIQVRIAFRKESAGTVDSADKVALGVQLVQSNESTALTDLVTVNSNVGAGYTEKTVTLAGAALNTTKAAWDAARLRIFQDYTAQGAADATSRLRVSAVSTTVASEEPQDTFSAYLRSLAPVSYWRMSDQPGATKLYDELRANDGTTVTNIAFQQAGLLPAWSTNKAADFDGTSSKLVVPNTTSLQVTTGFTLHAIVTVDSLGTQRIIFEKSGAADDNYGMSILPTGAVQLYFHASGAWPTLATSADLISAPGTYQIVGTYNQTNLKIYVNGVERASLGETRAVSTATNQPLNIGAGYNSGWFDGKLDELAVWRSPLTATQIANLYTAYTGSWSTAGPLGTGVLDDFNRPDGPVGSSWTNSEGSPLQLASGQLRGTGGWDTAFWNTAQASPHEAFATIGVDQKYDNEYHYLYLTDSMSPASMNGYAVEFDENYFDLFRITAGSWTRLNLFSRSFGSVHNGDYFVSGDGIALTVEDTSVVLYRRRAGVWSEMGRVTDATHRPASMYRGIGFPTGVTYTRYDDLGGRTASLLQGTEPALGIQEAKPVNGGAASARPPRAPASNNDSISAPSGSIGGDLRADRLPAGHG